MQTVRFHLNLELMLLQRPAQDDLRPAEKLLRFATSARMFRKVLFDSVRKGHPMRADKSFLIVPHEWIDDGHYNEDSYVIPYRNRLHLPSDLCRYHTGESMILSNAQYVTNLHRKRLGKIAILLDADVVTINIDPAIMSYREKMTQNSSGMVVGIHRLCVDSITPHPMPKDWPHHMYLRPRVVKKILQDGTIPLSFGEFMQRLENESFKCRSIAVGGEVLDLENVSDFLALLSHENASGYESFKRNDSILRTLSEKKTNENISRSAKIVGPVLVGEGAEIAEKAVIVGPAVIGNFAKVEAGAVVRNSIVGHHARVAAESYLYDRYAVGIHTLGVDHDGQTQPPAKPNKHVDHVLHNGMKGCIGFRTWSRFSYIRFWKRFADIIVAVFVLTAFLPFAPFVALAVKLGSPGPVFFGHKRQGLHGRTFKCWKFRSMMTDAPNLQDKLRSLNQVDGPQFSIKNDPRTNRVGKFLRDSFIDEIPQFINVLLGHMSVVGPRPSPESENILCPSWRNARLSVRPGVTGLWQVKRTRKGERDFQEWIQYDREYVRKASLWLDIWICYKTAMKVIENMWKVVQ